jgi:hypothetical protein
VAAVPWARHDSRFTMAFEDQCCWLAVNTSKKAVSELMRVTLLSDALGGVAVAVERHAGW